MTESAPSPVPREARAYQGQRAGLVTRFVAAAIDGVVVVLVLVVGYAGVAVTLFLVNPQGFRFPDLTLVFSLAAAFVVLVVYLALSWWVSGRSYGCLVMGLRVVSFRGQGMRLPGAVVRALFCAAFPIGLLWIGVSRENRSVQDVLLRTSVIYDWQPKGAPGRRRPELAE